MSARTGIDRPVARTVKRLIDVGVVVLLLALMAPLLAAVAVAIRLRMGAPVLFRQARPGRGGALFTMVKFRTMSPARSVEHEDDFDDRLTRLGRFLRQTSIDELPELFNVLKGDLSLVGPRPLLPEYLPLYNEQQARRHDVPPGITGWAQINGRNTLGMEQRFEHDVWYVDNWSLKLDFKILLRTARQVITGDGEGDDGAPITPMWLGNGQRADPQGRAPIDPTNHQRTAPELRAKGPATHRGIAHPAP